MIEPLVTDYGWKNSAEEQEKVLKIRVVPLWVSVLLFGFIIGVASWVILVAEGFAFFKILLLMVQVGFIILIATDAINLRLGVSKSGLKALSQAHRESLFNKSSRNWSDLHSVRLRRVVSTEAIVNRFISARASRLRPETGWEKLMRLMGGGWLQQGFLMMDFRSGGTLFFPLAGFSPQGLEDLFIAISTWADPLALNPEVVALQRDIFTGQPLHLTDSFTKMWEDDLRSHFQATNFVPLPGGTFLQNGKLKILMQLACGGMSSIYLATTPDGKRRVVKELVTPHSGNNHGLAKVQELFAREAQLLMKVEHPHIVRLLDHFVEAGRNYIVLDYIPGLNLKQHVSMHGVFSEAEVLKMAEQVAEILEYLHSFDPPIIHRDLTPDNLVIRDPDKAIILIDFGAANEFVGNMTGTLIGKQSYIPPEQFQGEAVVQSDLYALGATMFFLLTGKEPEPISASRPREFVEKISVELDELVFKLTQELPEERISSARELRRSLGKLIAG